MFFRRHKKIIAITSIVFLVIQIAWLIFFYRDINNNYIKTTATVVRMGYAGKSKQYPIYEFADQEENKITVDNYTTDNCGAINIPCRILQPDVGDNVTTYYQPENPNAALFMTGNFLSGDVRFVPVTIAMSVGLVALIIWGAHSVHREYKRSYIRN
jgi:hypothetical protein